MLTLNQDYETELVMPLHIKQIPDDVGFSGSGEEFVTVRVRDRGTTLMNYMFTSFLPLTIDYSELGNKRGRLSFSTATLKKRIEGQLLSSTKMLSVQPDTFLYYTRESALRIPVQFGGEYVVAKQYTAGTPILIPDSAWVYAPKMVADTIEYINTELADYGELRDSLYVDAALILPNGVKCVPEKVAVVIPVSPFAEKSFEMPIIAIGFPDSLSLKTFPSFAKVIVNVNMSQYDSVTEDDFEIGVKYSDIASGDKQRAKLYLLNKSVAAKDIKIYPEEVEYIIEQ